MRIAGVNIPDEKRVDIGLTYLFGVGRVNALEILKKCEIDPAKRVKVLSEEDQKRLQDVLEKYKKIKRNRFIQRSKTYQKSSCKRTKNKIKCQNKERQESNNRSN